MKWTTLDGGGLLSQPFEVNPVNTVEALEEKGIRCKVFSDEEGFQIVVSKDHYHAAHSQNALDELAQINPLDRTDRGLF